MGRGDGQPLKSLWEIIRCQRELIGLQQRIINSYSPGESLPAPRGDTLVSKPARVRQFPARPPPTVPTQPAEPAHRISPRARGRSYCAAGYPAPAPRDRAPSLEFRCNRLVVEHVRPAQQASGEKRRSAGRRRRGARHRQRPPPRVVEGGVAASALLTNSALSGKVTCAVPAMGEMGRLASLP